MADVSKITVPTGTYNIKDATARSTATAAQNTANAALPKAGGTMTGGITLQVSNSAFNDYGIIFNSSGTKVARIGSNNGGDIGIYSIENLYFRPSCTETQGGNYGMMMKSTDFSPTSNEGISLGTSSIQFNKIYGKTLYENGTSLGSKYLALSGGTMTGALTLNKMVGSSGVTYATSVPTAAGTVGQIVFVIQ